MISLHDALDFLNIIKRASMEAVETSKPADFCFGTVTSTSPLKISVEQKMSLNEAQLVLTRNVTDYKIKVTMNFVTENQVGGFGESSFASHNHNVKGQKEITVHNALSVGENVILIRQKGGQKYLVIDRVVST